MLQGDILSEGSQGCSGRDAALQLLLACALRWKSALLTVTLQDAGET